MPGPLKMILVTALAQSRSPKLSLLCADSARSEAAEAAYLASMVRDRQPIRLIKSALNCPQFSCSPHPYLQYHDAWILATYRRSTSFPLGQ